MSISVVQFNKAQTSGGSSLNISFAGNVTAGNLIVVAAGNNNNGAGGTFSINDGALGNTYTKAIDLVQNQGGGLFYYTALYYAKNINGGACTVSVSNGGLGSGNLQVFIYEISGLDTTAPLDQTGTGTSASVSTGSATTTAAEYVIAYFYDSNTADISLNPGSGYTDSQFQRDGALPSAGITEDAIIAATGTQTATATGFGGNILALIATFAAPGSSPTVDQFSPTFDGIADGGLFGWTMSPFQDTDDSLAWFPFPIVPPQTGPLAPASDQITMRVRAAIRKQAIMSASAEGMDWTEFIILPAWNPALGNSQDTDGDWQKPAETPRTANLESDAGLDWTRFIILPPFEAWSDDDANLATILLKNGGIAFFIQEEQIQPPNIQPTGPATGRSTRLGFYFPALR